MAFDGTTTPVMVDFVNPPPIGLTVEGSAGETYHLGNPGGDYSTDAAAIGSLITCS